MANTLPAEADRPRTKHAVALRSVDHLVLTCRAWKPATTAAVTMRRIAMTVGCWATFSMNNWGLAADIAVGRITIDPTMTTSDLERQNHLIVECLRRALDPLAIYRFGSTAHGTASAESDHDIAVLARGRISPTLRFDVQEQLAAALGRDVDLVDLASASTVMAMQAIGRGAVIFEGDAAARGDFEDRIYGAYARLNEERRSILERAAAEGTIYGR